MYLCTFSFNFFFFYFLQFFLTKNTVFTILPTIVINFEQSNSIQSRALWKTVFAEIFVFASFGNWFLPKFWVEMSFLSFYRTRLDSRKLVPTLIFAFFCDFHFCEKNDVQLVSSQLAKTRSDSKLDSKFWIKVRNAGPYY